MSKFIALQEGIYVPASSILKVTGPFENILKSEWYYIVSYSIQSGLTEYHSVYLNKTFTQTEGDARIKLEYFLQRLNNLL
jgi:hypothetical protein